MSDMLSGGGDSTSAGAISDVRQLVELKGVPLVSPPDRLLRALRYSSSTLSRGMTSTVVVRMDSSCMAVGRYTRCLVGFSIAALAVPEGRSNSSRGTSISSVAP